MLVRYHREIDFGWGEERLDQFRAQHGKSRAACYAKFRAAKKAEEEDLLRSCIEIYKVMGFTHHPAVVRLRYLVDPEILLRTGKFVAVRKIELTTVPAFQMQVSEWVSE